MQATEFAWIFVILGLVGGLGALGAGIYLARGAVERSRERASTLISEAEREGRSRQKELLVTAQETSLALQEEADRRERGLEEREAAVEQRGQKLDASASAQNRERERVERRSAELDRREVGLVESEKTLQEAHEAARRDLERVAGLSAEQARAELIAGIEAEATKEASILARKIEEEGRQNAERTVRGVIVQAAQRVNIRDVMESTVSFIELPSDEMKGRIIGKEGRNIRALEMATGIDLIVDDTPRSIWISCFDPMRREVARVAIDRLLEDGRIHPARIEEVVEKVTGEIDTIVEEKGTEAAFSLSITDLNPKLVRLVGRMRYHSSHGHNLLKHCLETAMIAGFLSQELGGQGEIVLRAGLLHEIGLVTDGPSGHPLLNAAELCAKYGESDEVATAIRSLHPDHAADTTEALLLTTANRLSENRPGARKENLAVFIERLRRLESLAMRFPGVRKAYALKSGKELRVIVDVERTTDDGAYRLSKQIAGAVEKELSYPGQIKVCVIRETRSVRFAV